MTPAGWAFLFLLCVWVPVAALRQAFSAKESEKPLPPKKRLIINAIVSMVILGALAIELAWIEGIVLFPRWKPSLEEIGAGIGIAVFWFLLRHFLLPWLRKAQNRKPLRLLPESPGELPSWAAISLSAGIFEEIIYRGVLFDLCARVLGSVWAAAAVACLVFSVAHIRQGWAAALLILGIAVSFQWLVLWTGTLYMAMIAHALYDFAVGVSHAYSPNKEDLAYT